MNPSAHGWIKKLLLQLEKIEAQESFQINDLYFALRSCGFIYGSNQAVVNDYVLNNDFTKEEYAKANLLIALFSAHKSISKPIDFVESVIDFYMAINEHKTSYFDDILNRKKSSNFSIIYSYTIHNSWWNVGFMESKNDTKKRMGNL